MKLRQIAAEKLRRYDEVSVPLHFSASACDSTFPVFSRVDGFCLVSSHSVRCIHICLNASNAL